MNYFLNSKKAGKYYLHFRPCFTEYLKKIRNCSLEENLSLRTKNLIEAQKGFEDRLQNLIKRNNMTVKDYLILIQEFKIKIIFHQIYIQN
jgi:hypothetical protein